MTEYGRKHTDGSRSGGQPIGTNKIKFTVGGESHELPIDSSKTPRVGNVSPDMKLTVTGSFSPPPPKPDPLVELVKDLYLPDEYADRIRAALDALGLEIREKGQ